jgi:phage tail-like protein
VAVAASAVATSGFGQLGNETITANRFVITLDGFEIATFQELSGITTEVESSAYWEASGENIQLNKLVGKLKPPTITLKRALTDSLELWSWHEAVRAGVLGAARRSASLTAFGADGRPVAKWWLEKAWPSKLETGTLKGDSTQPMIETVTLTTEYVQRIAR